MIISVINQTKSLSDEQVQTAARKQLKVKAGAERSYRRMTNHHFLRKVQGNSWCGIFLYRLI